MGLEKNIPKPNATGKAAREAAGMAERAMPATTRGRDMTRMTSVAASFALDQGVAAESGEAIMQGFRTALIVASAVAAPAILLSLLGGQRGVRVVAEKAAEGVQVVRDAIEVEISAMVPLFRGQKSMPQRDNGLNGLQEPRATAPVPVEEETT